LDAAALRSLFTAGPAAQSAGGALDGAGAGGLAPLDAGGPRLGTPGGLAAARSRPPRGALLLALPHAARGLGHPADGDSFLGSLAARPRSRAGPPAAVQAPDAAPSRRGRRGGRSVGRGGGSGRRTPRPRAGDARRRTGGFHPAARRRPRPARR